MIELNTKSNPLKIKTSNYGSDLTVGQRPRNTHSSKNIKKKILLNQLLKQYQTEKQPLESQIPIVNNVNIYIGNYTNYNLDPSVASHSARVTPINKDLNCENRLDCNNDSGTKKESLLGKFSRNKNDSAEE